MEATTIGAVDETLYYIAAFAFLMLFGIVFFLGYFAVRYRASRNPVPPTSTATIFSRSFGWSCRP